MKRYEEDTVIPWIDELPPCLPPGIYEAVVVRGKHVSRFGLLWAECQRSFNNPQMWSLNSPHPLTEGGERWDLTRREIR